MPFADNSGVHIHYEVVGDGPPLVLRHGFGGCLEDWIENGYVDALKGDYELILMDGRGQGRSDKPHGSEAYTLAHKTADVLAVLDELGMARASYWGYSGGGRVGWTLATTHTDRFNALIMGGKGPCDGIEAQFADSVRETGLLSQGIDAFAAMMTQIYNSPGNTRLFDRFQRADLEALRDIVQSYKAETLDISHGLSSPAVPCLAYCGGRDAALPGLREWLARTPGGTLVELPGLDHIEAFAQSECILPHVKAFLATVRG